MNRFDIRIAWRRVGWLAFALLWACGDAEEAEQPDVEEQSLTASSEACEAGYAQDLNEWWQEPGGPPVPAGDDRVCDGAWRYRTDGTCTNLQFGCEVANSCTSWWNGWVYSASPIRREFVIDAPTSWQCIGSHCEQLPDASKFAQACLEKRDPKDWKPNQSGGQHAFYKNLMLQEQQADELAPPLPKYLSALVALNAEVVRQEGWFLRCAYDIWRPYRAFGASVAGCGCFLPKQGTGEVCGPTPTPLWSSVGKTKAQLRATVGTALYEAAEAQPVCTTFPDKSDPDERYFELRQQFPAAPVGQARDSIYRAMLLLYEHRGHQMQANRSLAAAEYARTPDVPQLTCGHSLPKSTCLTQIAGAEEHGRLQRCVRLLNQAHVSTELVRLELADCLSLSDGVLFAALGCEVEGGTPAIQEVDAMLYGLWRNQLSLEAPEAAETSRVQTLALQLRRLAMWDAVNARSIALNEWPNAPTLAGTRERAQKDLWAELWKRYDATADVMGNLATLTQQPGETPEAFAERKRLQREAVQNGLSLARQRTVLASQDLVKALFTPVNLGAGPRLPLDELSARELFFGLLADGLGALTSRLEELAIYHDFACLFSPCAESPSSVVRAYRLLAALEYDHTPSLAEVLGEGPPGETLAGWRSVFSTINAGLYGGANTQFYWSTWEDEGDGGDLAPRTRAFVDLVRDAQLREARFRASGQLSPAANILYAGPTRERVNDLMGLVEADNQRLREDKRTLDEAIVAFTQQQIGWVQQGAQQFAAEKAGERLALAHDDLTDDMNALVFQNLEAEKRLGAQVEEFRTLAAGTDQNQLIADGQSSIATISGRDAKYTGPGGFAPGGAPSPSGIAIGQGLSRDVAAGRLLQVRVTGAWRPTCALRESPQSFLGPGGEVVPPHDIQTAVTGPEGYDLVWTGTAYRAETYSFGDGKNVTIKAPIGCGALAGGALPCYENSRTIKFVTNSKTQQDERRRSASFNLGMRMPNTPYPELPVGALLAVIRDPADTETLDVLVIRSGPTTILPGVAAKVHFVVNDRQCAGADGTSTLSVEVYPMKPFGVVADQVAVAMAAVLADPRFDLKTYPNLGRLLPTDLSEMKADATDLLEDELKEINTPLDQLPQSLLRLFNTVVERRLALIARGVEILEIRRQLDQLLKDIAAVQNSLSAGLIDSHLREVLLARLFSRIDEARLRENAVSLLKNTREVLYPALKIWYPKQLLSLANDQANQGFRDAVRELSQYASLEPSASVLSYVGGGTRYDTAPIDIILTKLVSTIRLAAALDVQEGSAKDKVRISFPKPPAFYDPLFPYNPSFPFTSASKTVDPLRAWAFWAALYSPDPEVRRRVVVEILPEDIYAPGLSGSGSLRCDQFNPVVTRVGFHFADGVEIDESEELNSTHRTLGGFTPKLQRFVTETGWEEYVFSTESPYKRFDGRTTYGSKSNANVAFDLPGNETKFTGLSPFGIFELDLHSALDLDNWHIDDGAPGSPMWGREHAQAKEFVIVLEIENRTLGGQVPGVASCQNFRGRPRIEQPR